MVYFPTTTISKDTRSGFGCEVLVSNPVPFSHLHYPHGLNPYMAGTYTSGPFSTITASGNGKCDLLAGLNGSTTALWDKMYVSYRPGQAVETRFTVCFPSAPGQVPKTTNEAMQIGIGAWESNAVQDGYFVGYNWTGLGNSSSFGIIRYRAGTVMEGVTSANFNVDKLDGTGPSGMTYSPTLMNVFRIVYQWLGAGMITFQIENPTTGTMQTFHEIRYANTTTTPSTYRPYFRFLAHLYCNTGGESRQMSTMSSTVMTHGILKASYGLRWSGDNTKQIAAATETSVMGVQNLSGTFRVGLPRFPVRIVSISIATDGTKSFQMRGYINPTIAGTSYTNNPDTGGGSNWSNVYYDTAGGAYTANTGRRVVVLSLPKTGNQLIQLGPEEIILMPGDTFHITAAIGDAFVGITWLEEQ